MNVSNASDPGNKLTSSIIKPILVLTTVFETITAFARFGIGLESTRDTASTIGKLTFGVRVHHGYIGILVLLCAFVFCHSPLWKRRFVILGWALFFSDLIHHFIVLRLATGSSQFDFWYN